MPQQHCASSACADDGIKDMRHHRLGKALRALKKWKVKCGIEEEANQELGRRLKQWKLAFEDERIKREEAESQLYKITRKQHHCFSELRREKNERLIIEGHLHTTMDRMKKPESYCVHNNRKSVNLTIGRHMLTAAPTFSIDKLNGYHPCNEEIGRVRSLREDNSIVQQIASPKSESMCSSFSSSCCSLKNRRETIADARCNSAYQDKTDMPHSRSSSITSNNDCTFDGSDFGKTLCYSSDSSFKSGPQPDRFYWDENHKARDVSSFPPSAERCTLSSSTGVAHSTYEEKAGCSPLYVNHKRATPKLFESSYMSPATSPDVSIANENLEVYGHSSSSVVEQPVIVLPEEGRLNLGGRDGESHEAVSGCGSGKPMVTSSEMCRNLGMPKTLDEIAPFQNFAAPLSPLTWDDDDLSNNGFEVKGEELKQHKKTPNLLDRLLVVAPQNKWHSTQGTPGGATLKQFVKHAKSKLSKKIWSRSGLDEKQIEPEKDLHTSSTTVSAEVLMQFPGNPSHPSCCTNVAEFCFPNGIEVQPIREDDFSMTEANELLFGGGGSRCQNGSFVFLITGNTADIFSSDSVSELPSQPMLYGCCLSFSWLNLVFNEVGAQGMSAMRAYCILSTCPVFDLHFRILSDLVDAERLMRAETIAGAMNSHNGTLSYCDMVPILADIDFRMSDLLYHVSKAYSTLRPPAPGKTLHFQVSPDLEEIHYTQSALAEMTFPLIQTRRRDFKFLEKLYTMLSAMEPWMSHTLFSTVRPSVIVQVLSALCRERQVLVMGDQPRLVSSCVLALAALLQPFPWLSPLVPILPSTMLGVLTAPVPFLMGLSLGTSPYPLDFDLQDQENDHCYDVLDIRNQVFYSSEGSLSIMDEGESLISQLTLLTSSLQPEKFASPIYEPTEAQREICRSASDLIRCHMTKLCNDAASQLYHHRCGHSGHDNSNITAFMRDFSSAQGFTVFFEACFGERKEVL